MSSSTTPYISEVPEGVEKVDDLSELLRRADVVTLHCLLTDETRKLIDRERLALMKPTALLINCARGPIVDEAALIEALENGRLAGARSRRHRPRAGRAGQPAL